MIILASPIIFVLFLLSKTNRRPTKQSNYITTSRASTILASTIMASNENANNNLGSAAPQQQPSTPFPIFTDALFTYIERCQKEYGKPFNTLLDAGTGTHSLRWISTLMRNSDHLPIDDPLYVEHYTAITADEIMRKAVVKEAEQLGMADKGSIIIGNWFSVNDDSDEGSANTNEGEYASGRSHTSTSLNFLGGKKFDTILADYLIGALDGFSPYYQDLMLSRLDRHLNPGGRIYIVGLQPVPDQVDDDANIVCKVTKLRDACILLAGHRCYREYPVDWIVRNIQKIPHLRVAKISQFPILYSHGTIVRQLNVARSKLPLFPSPGLAREMESAIKDLENESLMLTKRSKTGKLKLGFDYVVVVEKAYPDQDDNMSGDQEQECGEI